MYRRLGSGTMKDVTELVGANWNVNCRSRVEFVDRCLYGC